ncbi:Chromatin structure-remodeling complex subunit rsc9 [Erysiphe neolycopersici]|uniref:Chromatin structure-remodeling complex subunit rsc9 n=1 Tax=Erysiphe neolycopersici TaxID=212602 RepID=A0A420HWQ8_9PEZI|nr:Chromatin structure-remodeling complex subunit rsc9 [Erysiphe neolycopersici]
MAPTQISRELSLERSSEYVEFINKLAAYHQKRGTYFDPEPKVGTKHMNLLRLYKAVIARGGYDVVSDEKLAWRKLGQEFNLGSSNLPAVAFQLKGVYYKYLAAYEISTHWREEPPPKEILEDLTARGGGLRSRTIQNFVPPGKRDGGPNDFSEASGDDGTPSRERNVSEDTPGSVGRATRGLRQQPPQRIIFQPDTGSSRQPRNISTTSHPPQAQNHFQSIQQQQALQIPRGASTSYNPANNFETSSTVTNYEPRPQIPLTLRPIITPGNNPIEFAKRNKILQENRRSDGSSRTQRQNKGVILPGSGSEGPNIYVRCLCALRSGIPAEQDYALHHLVKISMERGDKYRFEGFPGLAEGLIEKLLEVSSLFYEVKWNIKYVYDGDLSRDSLNGLNGTPDILEKILQLKKIPIDDNIQSKEFSDTMLQINEAALTLRNMAMLEENALYVSELPLLRDFLSIALNLPNMDSVIELKHYALDIAEQITKYLHLDENDPLFISLLNQIYLEDRGSILTALRAISRISMNLEENNFLRGVPINIIERVLDCILLNDEDLVSTCLDFLYQYTAIVNNVEPMLSKGYLEPLINQLVRFLLYDARTVENEISTGNDCRAPAPTSIAPIPQELFAQLVSIEEPERSSLWLQCLFEEDAMESITQIALWQAYQSCFTNSVPETGKPLLPAAEFIKNVSTTFADKAAAQVETGAVQKFIIKGIRYRKIPVDIKGEEFRKCCWGGLDKEPTSCNQFFMSPQSMYQHILSTHLGASQAENGQFLNSSEKLYTCRWGNCQRFVNEPARKLSQIASHIKVHLPPSTATSATSIRESHAHMAQPPAKKLKPSYITQSKRRTFTYHVTAVDERQEAAGIPLTAVLILRNLTRTLPKIEANESAIKTRDSVPWVDRLFKPIEPRLFEIMALNKSLTLYMTDLLNGIKES